eukprot:scaffold183582_cov40-Tisochrysis_lutea.AAC.1
MLYIEEVVDGEEAEREHEGEEVENLGTLLGGEDSLPIHTLTAAEVEAQRRGEPQELWSAAGQLHSHGSLETLGPGESSASETAKARGNIAFGEKRFEDALA